MSWERALEEEMDFLRNRREDDALVAFGRTARSALLEAPEPAMTSRLVPQLAEAARASADTAQVPATVERRPARRRGWLVARVAIAAATVPILFAGLAFAGVKLPGPADDAFEGVGIELPNQADSDEGSTTLEDDGEAPASEGPALGTGKADGKRGHGKAKSNPARDRGRGNGKQGRGRALGKRGLAPGHSISNGRAVGRTDSTPPGQTNEPPGKGSSGGGHGDSGSSGGKSGGGKGRKK